MFCIFAQNYPPMQAQHKQIPKYTYADYLTWDDSERWELIDGIPYNMSPAPRPYHQRISSNLVYLFRKFFRKGKCKVYHAPFDVRLIEKGLVIDENIENVVQPDISVICDSRKIDDRGAVGAPDLIVEILSESTGQKDMTTKMLLYQKFRVKEYWIVDPEIEKLFVYALNKNNLFEPVREYTKKEVVTSVIFPKMKIRLREVFEE